MTTPCTGSVLGSLSGCLASPTPREGSVSNSTGYLASPVSPSGCHQSFIPVPLPRCIRSGGRYCGGLTARTPGRLATRMAGSALSSDITWPRSSSNYRTPLAWTRLPVSRVNEVGRFARSTTGCTGDSTKQAGCSTHGQYFGWGSQCLEGADDDVTPALLHGDLIPGNLLLANGRLTSVLDWGGLGAEDPAQDLSPA